MGRWYIYLHEWLILIYVYGKLVGKYTSAMDPPLPVGFPGVFSWLAAKADRRIEACLDLTMLSVTDEQ